MVKRAGASHKLHYVTCPEKTMRKRVLSRSDTLPDGALFINAAAIDEFKVQFEPPGVDEVFTLIETA